DQPGRRRRGQRHADLPGLEPRARIAVGLLGVGGGHRGVALAGGVALNGAQWSSSGRRSTTNPANDAQSEKKAVVATIFAASRARVRRGSSISLLASGALIETSYRCWRGHRRYRVGRQGPTS